MESGIYVIRNTENGKLYVGQSRHMDIRWRDHLFALRSGTHVNAHLQYAYNKYGENAFQHEVLEECSENILDDREKFWIQHFGGKDGGLLYNLTDGGEGSPGVVLSREARKKISETHKGKVVSQETRERMRQAQTGKKRVFTDEHRRNISESRKGRRMSEEQKQHLREINTGKKLSEEHKRKISQGGMGRVHSEETRRKMSESQKRRLGTL